MLEQYSDVMVNVRRDGRLYSVKSFIRPNDPGVAEQADIHVKARDFVSATQDFVESLIIYQKEAVEYWETPAETLRLRAGDCDSKAILACSILRCHLPADDVYCVAGRWDGEGHMWVEVSGKIVETTMSSKRGVRGRYEPVMFFNDKYVFGYPEGLQSFGYQPYYPTPR